MCEIHIDFHLRCVKFISIFNLLQLILYMLYIQVDGYQCVKFTSIFILLQLILYMLYIQVDGDLLNSALLI